jgi:hypothetical protein
LSLFVPVSTKALVKISLQLFVATLALLAANPSQAQIFVLNTSTKTINAYDPSTGAVLSTNLISLTGATTVYSATSSGTDIYVSESTGGHDVIAEYTEAGALVNGSWASPNSPAIASLVSGGDLYVANQSGRVYEYSIATGVQVSNSDFYNSNGYSNIAVSGTTLYATSGYPMEGAPIADYSTTTGNVIHASFINSPSRVTPDGLAVIGNNLFVANGSYVEEYNATTDAVESATFASITGATELTTIGDDLYIAYTSGSNHDIAEYLGTTATGAGTVINSDLINGVGTGSLQIFGESLPVVATPEPRSWALGGLVGLTILGLRRTRRSSESFLA